MDRAIFCANLTLYFFSSIPMAKKPRTFVPRALLYNDGGFDVSADGKTLCACAEYWLPDGVENAMDLLYPDNDDDDDEEEEDDSVDEAVIDQHFPSEETGGTTTPIEHPTMTNTLNHTPDADSSAPKNTNTPSQDQAPDGSHPAPSGGAPIVDTAATGGSASVWASPPRLGSSVAVPPPNPASIASIPPSAVIGSILGSSAGRAFPLTPETPPPSAILGANWTLSPPSPPGRRFAGGLTRVPLTDHQGISSSLSSRSNNNNIYRLQHQSSQQHQSNNDNHATGTLTPTSNRTSRVPPPPPPPGMQRGTTQEAAFTIMTRTLEGSHSTNGRFVPHVVTISLDTSPVESDALSSASPPTTSTTCSRTTTRRRLGQLLEACPLDGAKASAVTCVKFSPSTNFCLIGYGVREPLVEHNGTQYHPVTALYRVRGGMTHVSTMLSADDDVNIARFHPDSGYGFVYGTKQGRVRVLSPRPWNFYNC